MACVIVVGLSQSLITKADIRFRLNQKWLGGNGFHCGVAGPHLQPTHATANLFGGEQGAAGWLLTLSPTTILALIINVGTFSTGHCFVGL